MNFVIIEESYVVHIFSLLPYKNNSAAYTIMTSVVDYQFWVYKSRIFNGKR